MRTGKVFMKVLIIAVLAMFAASSVFAGTTGKIRGKVINKKTKEPIPSAPVQIEGTTMGALTGPDGEYMIINVPPKVYSLVSKPVGYVPLRVEAVEVSADHTTNQDLLLDETTIQIDKAQVVYAERDLLRLTETQNMKQLTAEGIKNMPVTTVQELLKIQVGVVQQGGQLHMRGGRSSEIAYIVDGVSITDPLGGSGAVDQAMNISGNVVEDMQVIKGGFDAEYGNATSGIVNINTKTGSDITTGTLQYFTDDFGTKILNKNSFNYDRLEFNLSGREPLFADRILPKLGINWFSEKLYYQIQGAADKSDGYANYKQYFTQTTNRDFKTRSVLGLFNLEDRLTNQYEAQIRLRWQATPKIKVTASYRGSWTDATTFQWNYRYTPQTAPVERNQSATYQVELTHQIDKATFYEMRLSRYNRDYTVMPGDPDNPGEGLTPGDFLLYDKYEYFFDRDGDGTFDVAEPFINSNGDTSWAWQSPFYTFGDAYLPYATADGFGLWPLVEYEANPEYRGVRQGTRGLGNSSAAVDTILTDWNGNGLTDFYESEAYVDINGDGKWNVGDWLYPGMDTNNNGKYDPERGPVTNQDRPEPYVDGDKSLGEPFIDVNKNGEYENGVDIFLYRANDATNMDLNHNSQYDGPDAIWSPGIPYEDRNGNGVYDGRNGIYDYGEPFLDLNGNGKWDARDGFYDSGHEQWAFYQKRSAVRYTADFKITKQFSKIHEVKSGISLDLHTTEMNDLRYPNYPYDGVPDGGQWSDRGIFRDFYKRKPTQGAIFLQDKMEYGGMIANLGLRFDFFIQSSDLKNKLSADQATDKSINGSQNHFSPRIGFSYPISDKAKVFFNYGHFYQLPLLTYMYARATQASNAFGIIGNENLDFYKTISYEFGLSYALSKDYVLDVSGFYKDEYGKINSVREGYGPNQRNVYQNSDYSRSRGLEMELGKGYGNYVQGTVNYSYAFAYGKSSNESSNYFDDFYSRAIPIQEFPLDWDVRHQVSMNLDLSVPRNDHPKLFGLKLPDNWGTNVIWQFGSGTPYTPNKDYPGLRLMPGESPQTNSMRYPVSSRVDIRAYKRFPFLGLDYTVNLWVNNLFNKRNVDLIYSTTGRYDTATKTSGSNWVYQGSDLANSPLNLGSGRNVRIGIEMKF